MTTQPRLPEFLGPFLIKEPSDEEIRRSIFGSGSGSDSKYWTLTPVAKSEAQGRPHVPPKSFKPKAVPYIYMWVCQDCGDYFKDFEDIKHLYKKHFPDGESELELSVSMVRKVRKYIVHTADVCRPCMVKRLKAMIEELEP